MYMQTLSRSLGCAALLGVLAAGTLVPAHAHGTARPARGGGGSSLMWINALDLLPGDPSVHTAFNAVNSGVGGGLSGLIVTSDTLGSVATGGGNKVVEKGLSVPPGYDIAGVRVCYELSNPRSYISQIRLAQVQTPPSSATVLLDDATPLNAGGPTCATSQPANIDAAAGPVLLSLRLAYGNTADRVVIRGLALSLRRHAAPDPVMWINPLALQAGDPSVQTSFNAVNSGVGSGLSGLVIGSTTIGDTATGGGNKVIESGLEVPPGYAIKGVRVCYELSNPRTYISQVRLAQVQNPPSSAIVLLDSAAPLNAEGPTCTTIPTSVDPGQGETLLSLRLNVADTSDRIVVRGLGLVLGSQ